MGQNLEPKHCHSTGHPVLKNIQLLSKDPQNKEELYNLYSSTHTRFRMVFPSKINHSFSFTQFLSGASATARIPDCPGTSQKIRQEGCDPAMRWFRKLIQVQIYAATKRELKTNSKVTVVLTNSNNSNLLV